MLYGKMAVVEYVGTRYAGWQSQKNAHSVQDVVETALATMYQDRIRTIASGRTDAGVHAFGQVISFRAHRQFPNYNLMRGLNSLLPDDISIVAVKDVHPEFHAIRSSIRKTYLYRLLARTARSAIYADRAWQIARDIEETALAAMMNAFVGTHDFTTFCRVKSLKEVTVRTVEGVSVERFGDVVDIRITANGFLHTMCRSMVGSAVDAVFDGETPDHVGRQLAAKDREAAGRTAPAHGLYLESVEYPPELIIDGE